MKLVTVIFVVFIGLKSSGQKGPVDYLAAVDKELTTVQEASWHYAKAATQPNLQKLEKRRHMLLGAVTIAIARLSALPPYQTNSSLRDSALVFLSLRRAVLTEDFGRIVDLEPVADQAFDPMEAFMKARELSESRLRSSGKAVEKEYESFAQQHGIKAVKANNSLSQNLDEAANAQAHFRQVYQLFFDNYKQESYFLGALHDYDISAAEQNRNALIASAEEGLKKLKKMPAYNRDAHLKDACARLLEFYRHEASSALGNASSFFVEKENIAKMNEARLLSKEAQEDEKAEEAYQKALKRFYKHSVEFTSVRLEMEKRRKTMLEGWNHAAESFLGKYMP